MDADEEREEIERAFSQLSQSQSSSKILTPAAPIPIPQSNVGNRRNRRDAATKDGQKIIAEPGFGNKPVVIHKTKRALLEGLRNILAKKKMPTTKNAFEATPLDNIDQVSDYLELSETGELLKFSSLVYGLRVDTTYNDAMATNCSLQPSKMKSQDMSKKTKAEQKLQQSTATQSLNLQRLQVDMDQDLPDDERGGSPDLDLDNAGGRKEGEDEEDEVINEEDMTEEQREKYRDSKPIDTSACTFADTTVKDLITAEFDRRCRNIDRKCDLNPMLMDDERKFRMAPSALLTNEYYQIATARYKDLNASGMLSYNAKVTHNGRMTLMHKRMDSWKDMDVHDYTAPPREFRKALSGLFDNAMREVPQRLPNYLFDYKDIPSEKKTLTTGLELADIEKKTREKILTRNDEYDFLDNDEHVEEEEYESTPTPTPPPITTEGDKEGRGETGEGEGEESQAGTSSLNPSETETSETSEKRTPQNSKKHGGNDDEAMTQAEREDYMEVMTTGARKRRLKKAGALSSVMGEDEIKMGPALSTDGLAEQFHKIFIDKVAMGSKIEWKHGANAEELQTDSRTINLDSVFVEKCSIDMDLMHLDKLWTAKYYTKQVTPAEVKQIKNEMRHVMDSHSYEKKVLYFKAGEYEFMGEDDKWTNPAVPPDEKDPQSTEDEPLVRQLEDENELERHQKALEAVEDDSDVDNGVFDLDLDDERIIVAPDATASVDDEQALNDDGSGFMSDDNDEGMMSSSRGGAQSDFTAGDDRREGEFGDVNGMLDPMFVSDAQPSAAVRTTGKADDSHWKGGENPENDKPKKEKKKKTKEEEEAMKRSYFDVTDNMLDKSKTRMRFKQANKNMELMKETDQLLMPVAVNVQPQLDYDYAHYYSSFFLPKELHSKYVYRNGNPEGRGEEEDGNINMDGRLEHYANMLNTTIREDVDEEGVGDVYTQFLNVWKHYPEIVTQQEMDLEERVRTGEMQADEAAAEMNTSNNAGDAGDGFDFDDNDFGSPSGAGGGVDDEDEHGDRGPALPQDPATLSQKTGAREASSARSLALASTHGYGMRVAHSEDGEEEGDAIATVGDREYHLRLIKLDTVAMKTALSDVLTNPMMVAEKLDETLGHFHRALPSQRPDGRLKRTKTPGLQTIGEDEEMEVEARDYSQMDESQEMDYSMGVDIEATMMEVPDAMNVTRALFAPPKEKAKSNKTIMFGQGASTSQSHANLSQDSHIELNGHHTLKSAFTCLPARMPLRATSDVTVASTIAMILHLANENNLILEQSGQNDGLNADANTTTTHGNWMNDFEVHCDGDDSAGSNTRKVSHRTSNALEVLQQLSADEDASDAEKRQRETEKMLAEVAEKQRRDMEEEMRKTKANGVAPKRKDHSVPSNAAVIDSSDDDILEVSDGPAFKIPTTPVKVQPFVKKAMPRKSGDFESPEGPLTKRARNVPTSNGAITTVDLDDTICID